MHRDADKLMIRLPDGMRAKIKALAKANRRSMSAEVITALDERLAATGAGFADTTPAAADQTGALDRSNPTNG